VAQSEMERQVRLARVPDTSGQPGEIAVRGNQTEAIEPAAMKQVHGIDDQSNVRCILPSGEGKLLLGMMACFDGVSAQLFDREWETSP
jgi:hypothetical protein